ncbi:hypothetical protein [Staphylococcus saccharolyticus]|uniref:Membrane spanning protein n=1 Tax=Staphylococcus saccharolyticus TaxID=33028 RepID=A0A380HB04_9STAP|nr:hypothetical protein [Staphylococcus saccharolyticus]MBL7565779.1 hypothetical protein [Staphylococcus saccharolyticus]MBL7572139.1 hypothetical protein [Staphylococcus saccharolyticus]QQB97697.1 hypothetical protein I6I31_06205 [Staphylococcus saccharolyticus]RTX94828.1 hypothetical protein CD145_08770 [Staphylococcus saccharolyticus]TAA96937.1 hypothetical protein DMB72_08990 [Staphylococcus saccharolyticus]
MIFNILLSVIIVVIQLIIGHFCHDIGFKISKSILLMLLPLGIGLFLMQVFYYERRFLEWNVPINIKLRLKYMYILTLLEYVAVHNACNILR